jgi:hypothetical protein
MIVTIVSAMMRYCVMAQLHLAESEPQGYWEMTYLHANVFIVYIVGDVVNPTDKSI